MWLRFVEEYAKDMKHLKFIIILDTLQGKNDVLFVRVFLLLVKTDAYAVKLYFE